MIGRNYGLDCILITQVASGELATKVRRRCAYLLGKVTGYAEINQLSRVTHPDTIERAKALPRFHWIFYDGEAGSAFHVPDVVTQVPENWNVAPTPTYDYVPLPTPSDWSSEIDWLKTFLKVFFGVIGAFILIAGILFILFS